MDPRVFVILVLTGEARQSATLSLVSALQNVAAAEVRLEEVSVLPSSEATARRAARDHLTVVALNWGRRTDADVRVCRSTTTTCKDRIVNFGPSDPDSERGRTLGFLIAAMASAPEPEPSVSPTPPAVPEKPKGDFITSPIEPPLAVGLTVEPHVVTFFDATFVAIGGFVDVRGRVSAASGTFQTSLFAGLGIHGAEIQTTDKVEAHEVRWSVVEVHGGAALRARLGSTVGLGMRAGLALQAERFERYHAPGAPSGGRALSSIQVALELDWLVVRPRPVFLVLSVGSEAAFGSSVLIVNGMELGRLAPLRGTVDLGVRFGL